MEDPEPVIIAGYPLHCSHCQNEAFYARVADPDSPSLDLPELGDSAEAFICSRCGYVHWFCDPSRLGDVTLGEATECLECQAVIPAGTRRCEKCGWTYAGQPDEIGE